MSNSTSTLASLDLSTEEYFLPYREKVIGHNETITTPYGRMPLVYADWTASGRLYHPIESILLEKVGPFVANTHTETTTTGTLMTNAYHDAQRVIKRHVNAGPGDLLIAEGSGMTGVVNKFQRMLGLRVPERFSDRIVIEEDERPVVFLSHMEHHSNHTSWLETIADVESIMPDAEGLLDYDYILELLAKYRTRKRKIASITACSNVTGIETNYHRVAKIMHQHGGLCFVDFACSAPYVSIDMHPEDDEARLDAIYFSPHKFLGGPGAPGILVFDKQLYTNKIPDEPGGGTVVWTNPWGGHKYLDDIEAREDGGTPPFLQTIKAALAVKLKEDMGVDRMMEREHELLSQLLPAMKSIEGLQLLAAHCEERLGVISFYIEHLHFNLVVRLLNDKFGIQTRGGCSCAGTYGHYLLNISQETSKSITDQIDEGGLSEKPGWVRLSIHPIMTNEEMDYIITALKEVTKNGQTWSEDYVYDFKRNEFFHRSESGDRINHIDEWYDGLS
ncbi:MAG: aminotransferase class V-fold PLP-dependent enzyme [Cyclobacteriaceae bacterium]